ncbi:conjugal transfer protein TraB [Thauera sp. 27]|uniref:hypothetical protein n=1 Tax=Thauera sp. 27 TaxID=305700 RepID=UPI0002CDC028|nr:hypothetical protein [Thauera sp. 27]ENO78993.1 conjugal transfer protein TraB [Thauera sp. 27]
MAKLLRNWPALAGALVGWAAWGYGFTPLAALFFLLWGAAPNREVAYLTALTYYLAGSRVIPGAAAVFFGENTSLLLGIGLWLVAAGLLALPWGLLHCAQGGLRNAWRPLAALCLVTVPPLGFVGWLNPLLGTSLLLPGLGFVSLVVGLVLAIWLSLLPARRCSRWKSGLIAVLIGLIGLAGQPSPTSMPGWVGLTTHEGKTPEEMSDRMIRYSRTQELVESAVREEGTKVVVLPEQFLGRFNLDTERALQYLLGPMLAERSAHALIGAALPTGEGKQTANVLMHFDGAHWSPIKARFAVPVSMWKPWADDTTVINPTDLRLFEVAGQTAHVSLCFEDYMFWLHLGVFMTNKRPEVIIAVANGWWAQDGKAQAIQDEHINAWARIFKLPLVRSLNAS